MLTEGRRHAMQLAQKCVQNGYQLIVAVGGDGTANEVLNGFMAGQKKSPSEAAFAFINQGTGGDLQKSFGFASGLEKNLLRIRAGHSQLVDLGKVTSTFEDNTPHTRYFLNIASCGLSSEVAARINKGTPHLSGMMAYYWASLTTIFTHKTWPLEVEADGQKHTFKHMSLLALGNGSHFGGGMRIAPDAHLNDGLLDQIAISNMTPWFFITNGWRVYDGSHVKLRQVSFQKSVHVKARCLNNRPIGVEVEGENFGFLPATFEVIPQALKIII